MTKIQWTDETWNPVTGCKKVSTGCKNCYAERLSPRAFAGQTVDGRPRRFTNVRCHPERLDAPMRWRKPRRVFVNSMSDLFHEDVSFEFIGEVFEIMWMTPQHTFQVLTKRPGRMFGYFGPGRPPLPNVWLGVSVENQETADERIPLLLKTPAAVRFLSCEPLLGPIDLTKAKAVTTETPGCEPAGCVDWVIVGGESGPRARPCSLEWIRGIVAQCRAAGVTCFVKQLGSNPQGIIWEHGRHDRKGGDPAEWPEDLRVREFPAVEATPP